MDTLRKADAVRVLFAVAVLVRETGAASCRDKLRNEGVPVAWVDPDSEDACVVRKCRDDFSTCTSKGTPHSEMVLVFSDEFETPARAFGNDDDDGKWSASDLQYTVTNDIQSYKPDAVSTSGGKLKIKISEEQTSAVGFNLMTSQKEVYNTTHKSGQLSSWNKFCYTGGYLELSVKLPGEDDSYGLWPAVWLLGNLAKAGYVNSTSGFWPYSYNQCEGSHGQDWSEQPGQTLSACGDVSETNRTDYQIERGIGRGSPELDLLEIQSGPGWHNLVQSLQMAPLLPPGLNWLDNGAPGIQFPGENTGASQWYGELSGASSPRPGTRYSDTMSAATSLTEDDFKDFQTFGLDWDPEEYIRWYLNGELLYEINKEALQARSKGTQEVGERLIPKEPLYIIMQLAISHSWSSIDPNLTFPATMEIDYVRLYQEPGKYNLGCSPPEYPTSQWIACHPQHYILGDKDHLLIGDKCRQPEVVPDVFRDLLGYSEDSGSHRPNTDFTVLLSAAAGTVVLLCFVLL
ncbi:hypothetical protein BSKO_07291 [Bryopsis sp. KO-2023]|nr:hypothetical protein BSKO_07291 [Bryopsis sp. KO-2023]